MEFSPFCFDALRRRTAMLVPANSPFPIIMISYFLPNNYGFLHLASIKSYLPPLPCPNDWNESSRHGTPAAAP